MGDQTPFFNEVTGIELVSFDGQHIIDLGTAQLAGFEMYMGLTQPVQTATMFVYDSIGMFNNFPLIGEELVVVRMKGQDGKEVSYAYVITSVERILASEKNREMTYAIELSNLAELPNQILTVQKAITGSINDIGNQLLKEYFAAPLEMIAKRNKGVGYALANSRLNMFGMEAEKNKHTEATIVIPNLRPIQALEWLASYITPANPDHYMYMFWQAEDNFKMLTAQSLYKKTPKRKLKYLSDQEMAGRLSQAEKYDIIQTLTYNNRIEGIGKISAGYLQSNYVDINLMQKRTYPRTTELKVDWKTNIDGSSGVYYNSTRFIKDLSVDASRSSALDSANRVAYGFNNRADQDKVHPLMTYGQKWGNYVRTAQSLDSLELTIVIKGDRRLYPGDIIEIDIPKVEAFNKGEGNKEDKLISGRYLITRVKHAFNTAAGGMATTLQINRDTYTRSPDSLQYEYGQAGAETAFDSIFD